MRHPYDTATGTLAAGLVPTVLAAALLRLVA